MVLLLNRGYGDGGRCVCGGLVSVYTDIGGSLSPTPSMSCVLPLVVVGCKPDAIRHLFICSLALSEEDDRSNESDQAGV